MSSVYNLGPVHKLIQLAKELREGGKIDVVRLASKLNLKGFPISDLKNIFKSAYIEKDNGGFAIYVNRSQSRQRQRFSIAHEIAHYWLHKDELIERGIIDRGNIASLSPEKEKEADRLAASLLMPDDDIKEYVKLEGISEGSKISKKLIESLCQRYDVSFFAMIVLLGETGYYVRFVDIYAE